MNENYHEKIERTHDVLRNAEAILIGGGAGLSSSAGLIYDGERFTAHFADFIQRYAVSDMYSAGFYPFPSQEEKWAYWSRHIKMNRYTAASRQVYNNLLTLVRNKDYFVITTNVDFQFLKSGFETHRVFATQGNYGKFQCAAACHKMLYDNKEVVFQMVEQQHDCRIPTSLVPKCPKCGGPIEPNIRKDRFFVENWDWHQAKNRYIDFVSGLIDKRIVLLELGVGYNTPSIIKLPFEHITAETAHVTLIRVNIDYPEASPANQTKTIVFSEDIGKLVKDCNKI